jgi:glycosyltransferase involved in cell wall biosynthesis
LTGLKIMMVSRGVVPIRTGCGGSELVTYQLARFFAGNGHDVTMVADAGEEPERATDGLEIVAIESRVQKLVTRLPGNFIQWLLQHLVGNVTAAIVARRLLRERKFDLVHVHGNLSAILLSFFCDLPLVYTEHDAPPWQCRYRRWWERLTRKTVYRALNVIAFRRSHHVVATFESLRREIVERWGVAETGVSMVPNGANGIAHAIGKCDCGFERYCLFVGQLTSRKGPDFVVHALAEAEDNVCCVFAGDGPMRREIEQLAKKLGVANRIAFLGKVDPEDLAPLYANADLLILPSVSEASPLVVAEAMACGTPVLATRIAGVPNLVEDWETGFLVQPNNVGELAVALRFLMRDTALRRSMSKKARRKVDEQFCWSHVGKQYELVYGKLAPFLPPPPRVEPKVPFERTRFTMKRRRFDMPFDDRFDGRIDDGKPVIERVPAAEGELA